MVVVVRRLLFVCVLGLCHIVLCLLLYNSVCVEVLVVLVRVVVLSREREGVYILPAVGGV